MPSTTHAQQHQLDDADVPPPLDRSSLTATPANYQHRHRWSKVQELDEEEEEKSLDSAKAAQQWWRKWLRERIDVNISVSLKQQEQDAREDASAAAKQDSFWKLDAREEDANSTTSSGYSVRIGPVSARARSRKSGGGAGRPVGWDQPHPVPQGLAREEASARG